MNTLILLLILIIVNISGTFLGWLLTENYPTRIARLEGLNFKPFSCRPCLTFHIIAGINITIAIMLGSVWFAVAGGVLALLTFLALYIEDKLHIQP